MEGVERDVMLEKTNQDNFRQTRHTFELQLQMLEQREVARAGFFVNSAVERHGREGSTPDLFGCSKNHYNTSGVKFSQAEGSELSIFIKAEARKFSCWAILNNTPACGVG